jgi:YVTN family beta-propeller protein
MSSFIRVSIIAAAAVAGWSAVTAGQSAAPAARQRPHLMAVVSKGLPGVVLFDADTDEEICRATMAPAPHEAAFSRDGRTLYVPVYSPANIGQRGPDEHTIHFMRTSDCQIEATLDTADYKRPHFPEEGPSGMLYVTAELKESILVIDPKARKVVGTMLTGSTATHFFAMTRDGKKMVTRKVDVASKQVVATSSEALGTGTGGIQVSPFNGRVYITAYSGQVSVLDPDTLKVVKQFPVPATPDGLFFGAVR